MFNSLLFEQPISANQSMSSESQASRSGDSTEEMTDVSTDVSGSSSTDQSESLTDGATTASSDNFGK